MMKQEKALQELRDLLRVELGSDAEEAAEALVRYMGLVVSMYQAIENDPERRERLGALTKADDDSRMAEERSFTNQYEKP